MKKFILLVLTMVLVCAIQTKPNTQSFTLIDYFSGDYTCFTETRQDEEDVDLGFAFMSPNMHPKSVGEMIVSKNLEVGAVLKTLKAQVKNTETLPTGETVIYAYSNLIPKQVNTKNGKVNIQISIKDAETTIGWPLILGSF